MEQREIGLKMGLDSRMTLHFADGSSEHFPICNEVPNELVDKNSSTYLSLNFWCDFVDCDASDHVGGSELYLLAVGIPCSQTDLKKGRPTPLVLEKLAEDPKIDEVAACFFAGEFYTIKSFSVEFHGKGWLTILANLRKGESLLAVEANGKLSSESCKIVFPK